MLVIEKNLATPNLLAHASIGLAMCCLWCLLQLLAGHRQAQPSQLSSRSCRRAVFAVSVGGDAQVGPRPVTSFKCTRAVFRRWLCPRAPKVGPCRKSLCRVSGAPLGSLLRQERHGSCAHVPDRGREPREGDHRNVMFWRVLRVVKGCVMSPATHACELCEVDVMGAMLELVACVVGDRLCTRGPLADLLDWQFCRFVWLESS